MPAGAQIRSSIGRSCCARALLRAFVLFLLAFTATFCRAASISGVVTDTGGTRIGGVVVVLFNRGKVVGSTISAHDGSFQILTGISGRFFLLVSSTSYRQLETPDFYAGQFDLVQRNLVVEPAWTRTSMVTTATGTATPQPETSATTSVLSPSELTRRDGLVSTLRLMPGTFVEQSGQKGSSARLSIRGGPPETNQILLDGVEVNGLGGSFDFAPLTTTAIDRVEVERGPDSSLYGAGAASGVVSLSTPHGTTRYPSILFEGDAGNLSTSREQLEVAGARGRLDYLGAFSWLQTANDLPLDEYHVATSAANLGWQPSGSTQIRAILRYGVDATGAPGAWNFYQISNNRNLGNQNLALGVSLENQTAAHFHNSFQYGLARRNSQTRQDAPSGVCLPAGSCNGAPGSFSGGNYYGLPITIQGANGYRAAGPALLDYSSAYGAIYPSRLDQLNNRDQFLYQGNYQPTPHVLLTVGFHYEDEHGTGRENAYGIDKSVHWNNFDYVAGAHGDLLNQRLVYTLGAAVERYQSIGNGASPQAGLSFRAARPRLGLFSGTRLSASFAQGVSEPTIRNSFGSLYDFLEENGGQTTIQQMHVAPIQGPTTRTWQGGGEQDLWNQRMVLHATYFHNEFGRVIEPIDAGLVPTLLPNLTVQKQMAVEALLRNNSAYELNLNSMAYRTQGVEISVESGIGQRIFLRGGYTYLDSLVQRTFASENQALLGSTVPSFDGIPAGMDAPLKGARAFRSPPHTGFLTASYADQRLTSVLTAAFSSRSDDSTFLAYKDSNQGNSLVLPNRNLDSGYAKVDLG
ncbi:MAG: TonB-dependent receptor, partial [Terracidiphilus sp.]